MASIQVNSIDLEYETYGDGTPLLLVQGLTGQLIDWPEDFVALLVDAGFKVIVFDNRDIGLSTQLDWDPPSRSRAAINYLLRRKPTAGYHIEDMADDAAGLLEALGVHAAHVLGVSMGGMIAQAVTIRHPDKVLSLTSIMSHTGDGRNGAISKRLVAKLVRMETPTRDTVVEAYVEIGRLISGPHFDENLSRIAAERSIARSWTPDGANRQTAAIAASADRTAALANVAAPTLVIHGLVDPLVKPSGGVATAKAIPGSRLINYPDMGHDLPRSRWTEIIAAIVENTLRSSMAPT